MHLRKLPRLAAAALSIFIVGGSADVGEAWAGTSMTAAAVIGPRLLTSQLGAGYQSSVQSTEPVNMPQPNTGQTLPDPARPDEIKGQKGLGFVTLVVGTVLVVAALWALVAFVLRRSWSS